LPDMISPDRALEDRTLPSHCILDLWGLFQVDLSRISMITRGSGRLRNGSGGSGIGVLRGRLGPLPLRPPSLRLRGKQPDPRAIVLVSALPLVAEGGVQTQPKLVLTLLWEVAWCWSLFPLVTTPQGWEPCALARVGDLHPIPSPSTRCRVDPLSPLSCNGWRCAQGLWLSLGLPPPIS